MSNITIMLPAIHRRFIFGQNGVLLSRQASFFPKDISTIFDDIRF
jgi:hypothetical protein